MDRQDYVIEVSHVSKSFKDNKVLKDVSLLCESGKIYGLVGHNGSGKTVLFKSICGFLSCDEGTITVNGKVMGKDKDMLTDAGIIIEDSVLPEKIKKIFGERNRNICGQYVKFEPVGGNTIHFSYGLVLKNSKVQVIDMQQRISAL